MSFGVVYSVFRPDGRDSYLAPVSDLITSEIDISQSLEIAGTAVFAFPPTPQGYVVVGRFEDLTLTRYDFERDGTITQGERFSLLATGASMIGPLVLISDSKGYHLSAETGEITVYDPTSMQIAGSIPMPPGVRRGFDGWPDVWFDTRPGSSWQIHDGRLYAPVYWANFAAGTARASSGMLIVDVETDEVLAFPENRCPFATDMVDGGDGFIYTGTNGNAPFADSLRDENLGCIERIRIGSTSFDESYEFQFQDIDGSPSPAASVLSPSFEPGKALVTFLDESLATWSVESDASWYTNIWRVYEVDLRSRTIVREATEFGLALPWLPTMTVDDDVFVARGEVIGDIELGTITSQDYTLTRLTNSGFESGVVAPGEIWMLGRLF